MRKTINYQGAIVTVDTDGTIIENGKVRSICYNYDGYPVVSITTEKGRRSVGVARLIATAFIPNPDNLPEVNHKNYDRKDFSVENLEWMTHADNVRYSVCNKKDMHGANNPNYGNRTLHEFYLAHPEEAKKKQSRPGKQNGRYIDGRSMSKKCNDYSETEVVA